MNFSTIEDSVLEEKKKFNNFLSRLLKNSRVLIILLTAAVITAVSVSVWTKSPDYQVLYDHLSNEDSNSIINQLNKMKIPYQFTDISGQILVPKNKVYDIRMLLSENNLPRGGSIGFELLDKEKFGISQFNEQINYQRALEGELSRTIQKINIVKNARIHIAFPKSSLFLQDKKKPSASVVLELQDGQKLDSGQINAILHLMSTSIPNLSLENITIIDQLGRLLNQSSFIEGYNQNNDVQLKYSQDIESRYSNRIKNILEPLLGFGNVYAQVTAQIDFNSQEKTQEQYSPNTNYKNQAIRSHQKSIHDEKQKRMTEKEIPKALSNSNNKNIFRTNQQSKNDYIPLNSNIHHENTINYELDHSVLHTKMNVGEIKRLSAAVIINFTKDKNGKFIPLSKEKIKNIENLTREAIGYSKSRGDSIQVVNSSFATYHKSIPVKLNNIKKPLTSSKNLFNFIPWCISLLFLLILLKKFICPFSKNKNLKKESIENNIKNIEKDNIQKQVNKKNVKNDLSTDQLILKISNISNQNPRTIALIIRQWMSDKI